MKKLSSTSIVRRLKRVKRPKLTERGYTVTGKSPGPKLRAHMTGKQAARDLARMQVDTSGNLVQRFMRKREIKRRKRLLRNPKSGLRQFMRDKPGSGSYIPATDTYRRDR